MFSVGFLICWTMTEMVITSSIQKRDYVWNLIGQDSETVEHGAGKLVKNSIFIVGKEMPEQGHLGLQGFNRCKVQWT